ncbi:hypothetical protein HETIRDRAFT_454097 [Heterobasidion irregulare TC 32-1]|uniref:Uncharacterized protein n=1 Tax=Heterobasidion irregulare (strain TC 32-1) TaxID=747525 RepID=W4JX55_HETIT|nr:uncharacterized protein HETIRDRAFT_454097 [Heterobasidion irregulare TC 32-1]ETW78039.1 hypothetical protein HETIRDRAFT_454097 [Heterobasidion irregulare TC 32-1]
MNHPIITRSDSLLSTAPSVHFPRVREEGSSRLHDLPNELWLQIFEWATFDPGFPNSLETAFSDLHYHLNLEWHHIDMSLETKSSLVCVCRRWYALATPLLYQAVVVMNENVHSLFRTLKQATEIPNGIMLGSLVRRLDVCLEREFDLPELGEIFGYISHLRILISASIYENDAKGAFEIAASRCSPTLQELVADVSSPLFSGFLERLPNLRTLHHSDFCPYVLPPLPNLRSMASDNCHSVCSAHFSEDATMPELEATTNISKPVFKALAENCPHLTHLGFHFPPTEKWNDEPDEPDEPIQNEVQEFGYHEDTSDASDDGQPGIATDSPPPIDSPPPAVPKYKAGDGANAPSLQVVQLLDRDMVYGVRRKYSRDLARALETLPGVRVEDHEGIDLRHLLPRLAAM